MRKPLAWITIVFLAALLLEGIVGRFVPHADALLLFAVAVGLRVVARSGARERSRATRTNVAPIRLKA